VLLISHLDGDSSNEVESVTRLAVPLTVLHDESSLQSCYRWPGLVKTGNPVTDYNVR
jgi:hypothetical protein